MDIDGDEISPAVKVQVRLDSARSALWAAMNAVPSEGAEWDAIRLILGSAVNLTEIVFRSIREKTGV